MNKLALGTAQFGMDYGISNENGKVLPEVACSILDFARSNSVDTIDTAIAYGDSESCLGNLGLQDFNLITKLPAIPDDISDVHTWVQQQVFGSLSRLKLTSIYGLLLHRPEQLISNKGDELALAFRDLKHQGLVQKIGVSIYEPKQLASILKVCDIDIVQAPLNLLDRRLLTSGWLQRLHDSSVEVHVRSVFLQGLLLLPRQTIPAKFERWHRLWDIWHNWLIERDITALYICLQYVLSLPQVSRVVVGVESVEQFREILLNVSDVANLSSFPEISSADEKLINPSNWNLL